MPNDETPPSTQLQARALGDPTRSTLYALIAESHEPLGIAELAQEFEFHHNAIRQHVQKLVDARLVIAETEDRSTPGRPRILYRPDPISVDRWRSGSPYHSLSMMLLEMVTTDATAVDVGLRSGRATDIGGEDDLTSLGRLALAMARSGFDPKLRAGGDHNEFILRNCPFADAAATDPDTICDIHLGLARGYADQLDDIVVDDLVRANPHRAGCRLILGTR